MRLRNKERDLIAETTWALHGKARFPRDWRRLATNWLRRRKRFLSVDRPKVFPYQSKLYAYRSQDDRERGNGPISDTIQEPWKLSPSTKEYVRNWMINNHLKV